MKPCFVVAYIVESAYLRWYCKNVKRLGQSKE